MREPLPRRWVIDRTFGWLIKNRRLVRDLKQRTDVAETLIRIAATATMLRLIPERPSLLKQALAATHVPFRGAAQTIPAMLSGHVRFALDNLASHVPVIRDRRMRALAVTSAERWPTLPDVPTMGQADVPDFVVTSWQGFVVPRGTPAEIVARLSQTLRAITQEAAMQQRFLQAGATMAWSTPEELAERARRERPMWPEAVRLSGATAG